MNSLTLCATANELLTKLDVQCDKFATVKLSYDTYGHKRNRPIRDESVPIQLAQCWFPGLAIFNAKICKYIFFE